MTANIEKPAAAQGRVVTHLPYGGGCGARGPRCRAAAEEGPVRRVPGGRPARALRLPLRCLDLHRPRPFRPSLRL